MARKSLQDRIAELPDPPGSPAGSRAYLQLTMDVLRRHGSVLGELRTRASIVLTATGLVASLLGSEGLKHPHPAVPLYLALACLGAGILACIAVLWPVSDEGTIGGNRQWQVTPTPKQAVAIAELGPDGPVPEQVLQTLATARLVNYETISRRTTYFNAACVLLLGQLTAWVLVFQL